MTKPYPVGSTIWQELRVASVDGVADFYAAVLGWTLELDGETGLFRAADGEVVAGLRLTPDAEPAEIGWIAFLGAEDLSADVARAVAAGSEIIADDANLVVPGAGVILRDPFGAPFGIAELPEGSFTIQDGRLGRLSLVDPTNHDVDSEIAFQDALFPGQSLDRLDFGINLFRDADGTALRGAYEIAPEAREFIPPHWLCWFNVASQAEAAATAEAKGGRVNVKDAPLGFADYAVVVDPAGGSFKALELHRAAL